jgi:ribosome-binding protein aMBF1 (putative translation factor)
VTTTTTCDLCGTANRVKQRFVTVWNGNTIDLCMPCAVDAGLVALLDKMNTKRSRREVKLAKKKRRG